MSRTSDRMQDLMVKLAILIPEREAEFADILGRSFRNFSFHSGRPDGEGFLWDYLERFAETLDEDFRLDHFAPLVLDYWSWDWERERVKNIFVTMPGGVHFYALKNLAPSHEVLLRPRNRRDWAEEAEARRKIIRSHRFKYCTNRPVGFANETEAFAFAAYGVEGWYYFYYYDQENFVLAKVKYS